MPINLDFTKQDKLSSSIILGKISPEQIMNFYYGKQIPLNKSICSPFRKDIHPSFSFKIFDDGRVIWKDWGTEEGGDCFEFVKRKYNVSFYEALKIINDDFSLHLENGKNNHLVFNNSKFNERRIDIVRKSASIYIEPQLFTNYDYLFWKQYGIGLDTLLFYNVCSCRRIFLNNTIYGNYSSKNLIYAYKFGELYKIYFPLEKKSKRFIGNNNKNTIEGDKQLPSNGELLIITKSLKDVMFLYELEYSAISFMCETITRISPEIINNYKNRFKKIIMLYDNDRAGIRSSQKIAEKYNLQTIFIPIEYQCKDITDFYKNYGLDKTKMLLNELLIND